MRSARPSAPPPGRSGKSRAKRDGLAGGSEETHAQWWAARIARQKEIDASIAAKAEFEYLYDKPYADNSRIRVAGPFTVESLSPHRVMAVDAEDSLIDQLAEDGSEWGDKPDFAQMVLDNLKTAGVQQAHKEDRITFTSLAPWPGELIGGEGRYMEGDQERRAAIFLGPEFGTVARADLVAAAREAADARFDVVIACAFNFDAHSAEFDRLGRIPILKARMNPDLHMADALKTTASGNLFVVFGEPDIEIEPAAAGSIQVSIKGVDVFHPQSGEIESRRPGHHRSVVHRHRLQRGKLLRPPRLFPRRRHRPLQGAENDAEGRHRRGSLGRACAAPPPARSRSPNRAASRSRSSTTSATRS